MQYSSKFKAAMVRKMAGPDAISANALSREVGVSQTVLSRWLRLASNEIVSVAKQSSRGAMSVSKRPQDWTPEEKLRVVLEAQSLSDEELGGFLRKNGLYEAHLKEWREQILAALAHRSPGKSSSSEQRKIRDLEKELDRKDKALAETAALLVLQKKARILFGGDEDEPTQKRRGK